MNDSCLIKHQCPQCGAPVTLQETDHILACPFCRVRLYLMPTDGFRYVLPCDYAGAERLVYIPYWRCRGMAFSCREWQIEGRVIDTSWAALKGGFLPQSLGLRPQALELRFAGPDSRGDFIRHQLQLREVLPQIAAAGAGLPLQAHQPAAGFRRIFIGEAVSLIYAPYICRGATLCDALGQQALELPGATDVQDLFSFAQPASWGVRFMPTLCPACGWDLMGDKESCVLVCRQCASAWDATGTGFHRVAWGLMPGGTSRELSVPFWRVRADIKGLRLETRAGFGMLANLPWATEKGSGESAAFFWLPAFKIQPKLFMRLARQMTMLQPDDALVAELDDLTLCPVTLPAAEASEAIVVTLAQIAADKKQVWPLLSELEVALREAVLVYVPFSVQGSELVQMRFGFSISRAALRLGVKI